MSHKVHPKIFKVKEIKDWQSRGFYDKNLPLFLEEDFRIRKHLKKKLPQGAVSAIEIERTQTVLKVIIKTSRPALIIGRGGKGVAELKQDLERILAKIRGKDKTSEVKIEILEIRNPWVSASLVAQWIAGQLEKKVPFRRSLKMAMSKVMENKEVKGARLQVAGRLNGVDISRTEWIKQGNLPRQNLRAQIDYGFHEAYCTYGVIGIKAWLYKGEKFE